VSAQRAIVMILAVYVALVVTSSLQALSPWRIPTPEVALLVVLYLGLGGRGTAPGHLFVALVIGYLADLFAGSPKGLESLTLAVAMLLARAASSRLDVATPWHTMVIALHGTAARDGPGSVAEFFANQPWSTVTRLPNGDAVVVVDRAAAPFEIKDLR